MKALVMEAYKSFALREVPLPQPGLGEVLVRVRACAVCGSDVHGIDGSTGRRRPPVIMGHEAAGEIAELGAGGLRGASARPIWGQCKGCVRNCERNQEHIGGLYQQEYLFVF